MERPRLVVAANAAWNLVNFRANLLAALIADGYDVIATAPADPVAEAALATLGCRFHPVPIDSAGLSPSRDLRTLFAFRRVLAAERPVAFLGFTVKPNTYGSLAAASLGVPAINNITGLGTAFLGSGWLTGLVSALYRVSLAQAHTVFFQNADDRDLFLNRRLVRKAATRVLPGSGVDLERFAAPATNLRPDRPFTALLVARLINDKGVREFVDAARRLRRDNAGMQFQLLGAAGADNRTAITLEQVQRWVDEGVVQHLGIASDVRPFLASADCVVLPSYREGTSRVLLEAAAMGRPLVATNVPGCREVVEDGVTGFLCRARSADDLTAALARMAALSPAQRSAMGLAGRRKIEREFDERIVIDAYRQSLAALRVPGLRGRSAALPKRSGSHR